MWEIILFDLNAILIKFALFIKSIYLDLNFNRNHRIARPILFW